MTKEISLDMTVRELFERLDAFNDTIGRPSLPKRGDGEDVTIWFTLDNGKKRRVGVWNIYGYD